MTAVAHAVILAGAGMGVYGAFVLLAAILNEPLFGIVAYVLIAITVFTGISRTFHSSAVFSLFDLLRGTSYHVDGVFPWTGVLAGLAAGALFIRVAATAIEHRDF
ncbi:MAG: hypothetical protein HYZ57_06615 [Acidobacteria bacterium]|nr:hypothetical protein [Acidobacteriota bacterium]